MTVRCFRESENDAVKAHYTFKRSRHHWTLIQEEVRAWVEANWSRWEEEKPKWLDDEMRAKIPVEFIPIVEDRVEEKQRRQNSRGASIIDKNYSYNVVRAASGGERGEAV